MEENQTQPNETQATPTEAVDNTNYASSGPAVVTKDTQVRYSVKERLADALTYIEAMERHMRENTEFTAEDWKQARGAFDRKYR